MSYKHKCDGTMFVYDATDLITINSTAVYHAVIGLGVGGGTPHGVTFLASAEGIITDTANNGGVLRCTDVGHGLTSGQYITTNGMGDPLHNGQTRVTVIDPDTFDCDDIAYNSINDTGVWQRGSSLTVDAGHGGNFILSLGASFMAAAANKNIKWELVKNITHLDEFASESKISTGGDLKPCNGTGIVKVLGGDVIWLMVQNTTDSANVTIKHCNVHLAKTI